MLLGDTVTDVGTAVGGGSTGVSESPPQAVMKANAMRVGLFAEVRITEDGLGGGGGG